MPASSSDLASRPAPLAGSRSRRALVVAVAALGLAPAVRPAAAKTKKPACTIVDAAGLTAAIAAAAAGDTLRLCAGDFAGPFVVDKPLTIAGAGSAATTLSGSTTDRAITFGAGATGTVLSGVTVTDGDLTHLTGESSEGGGIRNAGSLTLDRCVVRHNAAVNGGGIFNAVGATLTLTRTTVAGNVATPGTEWGGGGGIRNDGTLHVTARSVIGGKRPEDANASSAGGGLLNVGTGTGSGTGLATFAKGTKVTGNRRLDVRFPPIAGAGIFNGPTGTVTLATKKIVTGNDPDNCGGGGAVANCVAAA